MTVAVLRADARCLPLPDASVDLVVTSPPYFGLRSYTDGGAHYDGQIGSEATPAEWLANLVACTAEWVRVLKPSGSIFVNLGDSFAGSSGGGSPSASSTLAGNGHVGGGPKLSTLARGQRPRQPRGQQFTREHAAWLAGVIDSDGSISVRINKQPGDNAPSFVPWVRVGQMRPEVVTRIVELVGTGKVMQDGRGVWHWTAAAQQARWVLERIHPWLLIKKRQAWAAIEVARHVEERNARGSWRPLTADDIAYRKRLRDAVLAWNKDQPDDMPVPEPRPVALPIYPLAPRVKSLLLLPEQYAEACVGELGLIVRRDIIWAKPNGLPESVTDRCRSSHEYVFHLVKQPRYYSAVDEIREPQQLSPGVKPPGNRNPSARDIRPAEVRPHFAMSGRPDYNPLGKLPGSVWNIPSQPLTVPAHLGVDHFAAWPMELPRRIIAGWSPPGVCTACGEGRRPVAPRETYGRALSAARERAGLSRQNVADALGCHVRSLSDWEDEGHLPRGEAWTALERLLGLGMSRERFIATYDYGNEGAPADTDRRRMAVNGGAAQWNIQRKHITARQGSGYACACAQPDAPTTPALILDPFAGTGTTMLVAAALGRTGIGADLSADYCRLAAWRTQDPGERARAMQVPKPPPVVDGQEALFPL